MFGVLRISSLVILKQSFKVGWYCFHIADGKTEADRLACSRLAGERLPAMRFEWGNVVICSLSLLVAMLLPLPFQWRLWIQLRSWNVELGLDRSYLGGCCFRSGNTTGIPGQQSGRVGFLSMPTEQWQKEVIFISKSALRQQFPNGIIDPMIGRQQDSCRVAETSWSERSALRHHPLMKS